MDIPAATEVFVRAFSETRSRTYPYPAILTDGLWVMRDAPGRKRDSRKIEVVTYGKPPAEVREIVHRLDLGWHFVCDIHPPETDLEAVKAEFKRMGYRSVAHEGFFVHDLAQVPVFESAPPVRRVESEDVPDLGRRLKKRKPGDLVYGIWDKERALGWVESIPVESSAWVSDLRVRQSERGRGYGRALMSALLQGDKLRGIRHSVLLASKAGGRLYPHLGYRQIGTLLMFCPQGRD